MKIMKYGKKRNKLKKNKLCLYIKLNFNLN